MTRSRDTASIIPTVDAKGDLLVGTADNTVDNLPAGTNGTYLKANSASTTGLEWATGVESIVDAKGDLLVGTADNTIDNLPTGTNGQFLTANSATTTGLEWTTPASTGNAIINGAFDIWQRGTSFTNVADNTYTADRWRIFYGGTNPTSATETRELVTSSDVSSGVPDSIKYYHKSTITTFGSATYVQYEQPVENIQTLSGQNVTLSFWAKCDSARTITVFLVQDTGTGGSPSSDVTVTSSQTGSSNWVRYTFDFTLANTSGLTLGTANNDNLRVAIRMSDLSNGSFFQITGVQLEAGAVATPFKRNAPSIQAELAACQRYFVRWDAGATTPRIATGAQNDTTSSWFVLVLPVTMRRVPVAADISWSNAQTTDNATFDRSLTALTTNAAQGSTDKAVTLAGTHTSVGAQFRPVMLILTTNGFVAISTEL
jgi:hypothetical protein